MRSYLIAILARVEREPRYRQLFEAGDVESRHFVLKDAVTPLFIRFLAMDPESYSVDQILEAIDAEMDGLKPKVLLFDIGGVCVSCVSLGESTPSHFFSYTRIRA